MEGGVCMLYISDELDAVNVILASVGDSPVNSLESNLSVDVHNAKRMLENMSRMVQSREWEFNTGIDTEVLPDASSKRIKYNPTWIAIKNKKDNKVYVKRGEYLYNLTDSTYIFEAPITLTIIEAVDFEDLPQCFKEYITAKTAIKFQSRYLGDDSVSQMLVAESNEAYSDIVQYCIDTGVGGLDVVGIQERLNRSY